MGKSAEEWLKQADYDLETAEFMLSGGRFFYAVFLCHLCIEKALKGLFQAKLRKDPPRSHNLVLLLNEMKLKPPEQLSRSLVRLGEASVATRYPDELDALQQSYSRQVAEHIVASSKELLRWIKGQF